MKDNDLVRKVWAEWRTINKVIYDDVRKLLKEKPSEVSLVATELVLLHHAARVALTLQPRKMTKKRFQGIAGNVFSDLRKSLRR